MSLASWLDDLLPGKWPARIAVATVVLSASATGLPSLLPTSFLPSTPERIFLLSMILLLAVALLGANAVLMAVAHTGSQSKPDAWVVRSAMATIVAAIVISVSPLLLPQSFLMTLPERMYSLGIFFLLLALIGTLIVLFLLVHHVRKVEARANRSFWECDL